MVFPHKSAFLCFITGLLLWRSRDGVTEEADESIQRARAAVVVGHSSIVLIYRNAVSQSLHKRDDLQDLKRI